MEDDLESVALPDSDVNKPNPSATNDNIELARLLSGLELNSESIANISLNNVDLVQALIDLGGEKVISTHPNRGRQDGMILCINEETLDLWIVDDATKKTDSWGINTIVFGHEIFTNPNGWWCYFSTCFYFRYIAFNFRDCFFKDVLFPSSAKVSKWYFKIISTLIKYLN